MKHILPALTDINHIVKVQKSAKRCLPFSFRRRGQGDEVKKARALRYLQ